MPVVANLDERKSQYDTEVSALYVRHRELRKRCQGDSAILKLIDEWASQSEERLAIVYDLDRFETEVQYARPDSRGIALKAYYEAQIERLRPRVTALNDSIPVVSQAILNVLNISP